MLNNSKEINELYSQIGEKISQARKSSKRKISPISKKLKINLFYLKKIEDGDFENIPEGVYIRGYLKSYAKFLNIDILVELKKSKAAELSLFPKATIPEKYFDKFLESKSSKLLLLEYKGVW